MRIEVPKAMYGGDLRSVNEQVIAEYRTTGGQLETAFAGAPILLLTHRGATSGRTYTSPLAYSRTGDDYVVIGSMGGAPVDPQWCRNLVAHPDVEIEVGAETIPVRARVAVGEERERLFQAQAAEISNFDDYQSRTTRQLPVIVFERRDTVSP
jgi:deazaflavin-dependent oxidoreductase (nitroreductase family)